MCSYFRFFSFPRRMCETTKECRLTKDLVCHMITISENATPMTTLKWILGAIERSKISRIFIFLMLVICNTSRISAKVEVLLKKRHFQVNIEHSYSPIWKYIFLEVYSKFLNSQKFYPEHSTL